MFKTQSCILAFDMGGTFIKYACLLTDGTLLDGVHKAPSNSSGDKSQILSSWLAAIEAAKDSAIKQNLEIKGIGISIPGPFSFEEGKSLMKHKYQAIYGIDLRREIQLGAALPKTIPIFFLHDVAAFLKGEVLVGAAKGYSCVAGITLGTGLGFACMVDGKLLTNGRGSPHVSLYCMPYKDGILEDIISQRGICNMYRQRAGSAANGDYTVKQIADFAEGGDMAALGAIEEIGVVLGESIQWLLRSTYTECLVFGGQISRSFPEFSGTLKAHLENVPTLTSICQAQHLDDAPLYGLLHEWFEKYDLSL